jgi:hypothetical protein
MPAASKQVRAVIAGSLSSGRAKGTIMNALHKSTARSAVAAIWLASAGVAAAQAPPAHAPPPGDYACQALTPNQGPAYIDTLTLAPGEEYSLAMLNGGGGTGRYRYDAAAEALVFLSGPFAQHYVGQYVPPARGAPSIRIHESGRQSRQFDWLCAMNRR